MFDNRASLPWLPVELLIALSDHIFQSDCVPSCTHSRLAPVLLLLPWLQWCTLALPPPATRRTECY
ncbi:hypothetical protein E2C01_018934 [Portunus trituberculatus]|uniref:Uncharacterized protein n=1 Tax=Portunus trituberculatus TaxID=210409 RepID=A0A5B7DVZ0_PORTR|nr:hypothetical protein [Portunus trituberculatus]